ncbi:uncharacterized protein LOC124909718 [Impatiens glandulifera]|uniref:uncharacterized protein LOC124909718 n=1 Tax=Impatiens glandulifera TaxID=253017 RepID=UPI001FB0A22A|nr:uncharacterized protein LOC124909718 [Impatiens glandulifera]
MQRSTSTSKVYDEYLKYYSSSTSSEELPVVEPMADGSKKDRTRARFSENAVHLIPFILLLCALILWILSNPEIDLPSKVDQVTARVEEVSKKEAELHIDTDQTSHVIAAIDLRLDFDAGKQDDRGGGGGGSDDKKLPSIPKIKP